MLTKWMKKSSLWKRLMRTTHLRKRKKKRVNAFMDGDRMPSDYSDDDPEDEDGYEADPALSYDEEIRR